jgi:hypothetical protein
MNFHAQIANAIRQVSEIVEVHRIPSGAYDEHGRWNARAPEVFKIQVAVQPSSPKELHDLPENRRSKAGITIYSTELLKTVSTSEMKQPDRISWHGDIYEVEKVEEWSELGGYCKAIVTKVEST